MKGSRILFGSLFLLNICYGQLTFPDTPNPHGNDRCSACHFEQGEPKKNNFNPAACDACHSRDAVNNKIHQLNNVDLQAKGISVPKEFRITNRGQFDCTTCHAVVCKTDRANQTFLRGGPYKSELDFCFTCHQVDAFQQLNPHKQIRVDGTQDKSTCQHCHLQTPDVTSESPENSYMQLDMTPTCNKCHALHRHENQHLGKSVDTDIKHIHETIAASEERLKIEFPLSSNHEIQCNTCHYTHQRGVLNKEAVIFAGPQENLWRLRLSKEQLCLACHDL